MSHKLAIVAAVAVLGASVLGAQAPDLPSGPMQAKVRTACTECHDAGIIVQQRLSRGAWVKEVDKMTRWGALVDPQDHDAFVEYLSTNFPADKPPLAAPIYTPATKKNAGIPKR